MPASPAALLAVLLVFTGLRCLAAQSQEDGFKLFQASLPAMRATRADLYDTPEKLQTAWAHFQQNLALAQTARKRGYADAPEVRTRVDQMLAQEVILKEAETARPPHAISELEIRDYFEAHRGEYDLPAMLGAHEIVLRYEPAEPARRDRALAKAKALLKALGKPPVELRLFQEVARTNSDPQSFSANGGSLGLFPARPHRGQAPPVSPQAVAALLELKQLGRVTEVLDDGSTLRILRLSAYRPAVPPKLESFKEHIRRQLYLQARQQKIEELARESGWDPAARLTEEQVNRLLRPPLPTASAPDTLPPMPANLDLPTPNAPAP